ncbi:hypothetical protein EZV73_11165 [Acidaminobacter sp. JC074]|uniref:CotH kinase family protein n=1 Tax=Acidaminobacter sp. JC074 TaxID=2530199 RepID=UPI001F0D94E6|nr:CotH kinase family protein [Acidaminobacter sp. JC074]MCH4888136.1 hypothetical protein [Acidaminobacter sp. JC074]
MRWMKSTALIVLTLVVLLAIQSLVGANTQSDYNADTLIFPHDQVVEVNIRMAPEDLDDLNLNAMNETVYMADITYNGVSIESVGIRAKGNSSLKSVANSVSDRYSFKLDFDEYIDEQSFLGLEKLNLNNLFSDPSMMAEYLSYEALDSIGADVARTTYVNLTINGELQGLYLAVEEVDEAFVINHYGNANGELYKPEMGGGADLSVSDDYSGIVDEFGSDDLSHFETLVEAIEAGDVSEIMNTDSFLKYLAVSSMMIHFDAYQGGMFHNYYLYYNDGAFEWISWDLNMTFNGFPMSGLTDEEAIKVYIDEPVIGDMSQYPLVETVLSDDENLSKYHDYLSMLMNDYLNDDIFEQRVLEVYTMIKSYVSLDPTSFYSYEEFDQAIFGSDSIIDFMKARNENVAMQLSGQIESSNNGQGNGGSGGMRKPGDGQVQGGQKDGPMNQAPDMTLLVEIIGRDKIDSDILKLIEAGEQVPRETMKSLMDQLTQDQRAQLIGGQDPMMGDQQTRNVEGPGQELQGPGGEMQVPDREMQGQKTLEADMEVADSLQRDSIILAGLFSIILVAMSFVLMKHRR